MNLGKMMNMNRMKTALLMALPLIATNVGFAQDTATYRMDTLSEHAAKTAAEKVYRIKPGIDIPLTAATTAFTLFGFSKIYSKDDTPEETIRNLDVNNIPRFDRWAADVYSEKAADASDLFFNASIPLPLLLMLDKNIRKDAAKIGLLYMQAMSITGTLYTGSAMAFDRYRPYAYNPAASMGDRREGNARNAFFAGHVALVGTATFFTAKVYADYHPDSKLKWVFYSGAALATATTGYLRHRGGRHFPSDIVVGTAVGVLSGIMIPQLHKYTAFKNGDVSLVPFTGRSHGLAMTYRIH
jgi:membrane-associated phospholipid phosphatase